MEAGNLQIYWHESQPIYSLCFQKHTKAKKLITAGGDNKIRVWNLNMNADGTRVETIDFLTSLNQHEQAINAVRFNPAGDVLASAGDDGQLLLWTQSDSSNKDTSINTNIQSLDAKNDGANGNESWFIYKRLNSQTAMSSEIYDIAWSPDGNYIITGSMDNSLRVFDVNKSQQIILVNDNSHYVQGVTWDPQNKFVFVQSADRSLSVYELIFDKNETNKLVNLKLKNKIWKCDLPKHTIDEATKKEKLDFDSTRSSYLFHNETLPSFFRRLDISPCGNLIGVPAGVFRSANAETNSTANNNNQELSNAVYIYSRGYLSKNSNKPILRIPFLKKPAIVVSFNPNLYKLVDPSNAPIKLQYKLIYAIATTNEVLIYDTESSKPIAVIGNLHYTPLTDLAWSEDGNLLMVSSTDGFVSYVSTKNNILGEKLSKEERETICKLDVIIPESGSKDASLLKKEESKPIVNILTVKTKEVKPNEVNRKKLKTANLPNTDFSKNIQIPLFPINNRENDNKKTYYLKKRRGYNLYYYKVNTISICYLKKPLENQQISYNLFNHHNFLKRK
ncbi:hypothetical protein TPHA_0I00460 [Tetrapisispora phaffii CBS 4417]|uniref:CAF1B/HIR1 beta-propeller domain-containing protein n=1 Tax=Tetrapisispora phaffii (strain ATCC 24235 / CBS 4417 / NBRC 1672 / NRRL Y-8282 / UCD 70-5) TaxID=1071381 RepID=G8BXC4_TETPH|nr:hypothetical protein TPHA_0I00460 [Tetrapisispora phaffii CBS 4417]CCE64552.1 hypothetical protein TPHA_0I00460 [Tetrapisispora phaffii CBS 4417]